jgi:predicted nucleic acid-binding protein
MVKQLVVDASVAIKWLIPQQPEEADVPQALVLLQKVEDGEIQLHQPPHFIAEVMGVIARICPLMARLGMLSHSRLSPR